MLNLDSVKIQFSLNLSTFKPEKFNKTIKEIEDVETISFQVKPKYLKTGIKNIIVNESSGILDFSSKLIPGLYQDMININTIERYLDEINNLDLVKFNTNEIINFGNVRTCDVTNNIKVKNVATYINSLCVYKINDKYKTDFYIDESIIFDKNVRTKSLREHLTVYNKFPELLKAENKDFRTKINIEDFKNVLRFESRFNTFELMRKSFNIPEPTLINILNSNEKVNYNILNRITDISSINIDTFNNFKTLIEMKEKYKYSKIRNIQGDLSILHSCNYDIDLLKLFFKTNSTANNSRYIRHMKQLLKSKDAIDKHTCIDEKVNEMKEILKVA